MYNKDCCTTRDPCGEGEGDCDQDEECIGNLVCALESCGSRFGKKADCCNYIGIIRAVAKWAFGSKIKYNLVDSKIIILHI